MSNGFDPDQARHSFGSDLSSNCLQRLSSDDKTVVGILTFVSWINSASGSFKLEQSLFFSTLAFMSS